MKEKDGRHEMEATSDSEVKSAREKSSVVVKASSYEIASQVACDGEPNL